jgi:hypothetical protein
MEHQMQERIASTALGNPDGLIVRWKRRQGDIGEVSAHELLRLLLPLDVQTPTGVVPDEHLCRAPGLTP